MDSQRNRVALDCRALHWPGIGRYCRELAAALPEAAPELEFRWLCSSDSVELLPHTDRSRPVVVKSRPLSPLEQLELPWVLWRQRIDLLHAPAMYVFPLLGPRLVLTCHDLILKRFPQFMPSPAGRAYYNLMIRLAGRRAHRMVTVSEFTRSDVLEFWPGLAQKIEAIPNGVSSNFVPMTDESSLERIRQRWELPQHFLLYVGTIKRHKNVARLLEAYASLPVEQRVRYPLVMLAKPDPRYPEIEETIQRTGISDQVLMRSGIAETDLPGVYTMAELLIIVSLYEGFGLPLLEAMACGTATVAARSSALPEVGGDASYYVDPLDAGDIGRGISRLLGDEALRKEHARKSLERATEFSWNKAATRLAELYRESMP